MSKGWKRVKIGDLGKVVTGNTPPKKDPSNYGVDYPFIKPTDMDLDRRYVTSWDENYSEKAFKKYKNSYIPPKATGVVTIGTVGEKMFQADRYCFTNQSVNVVIANDDYDEDFIYYVLKINLPKVLGANPGTASGRHHVSKSNFCAIKIDVPKSKETQRKIASILSGYDDLIENNLKRIKLLEEQAQQTYEEWFVRFKFPGYENVEFDEVNGLPVGWEKLDLNKYITIKHGYAFKGEFFSEEVTNRVLLTPGNFRIGGGIKLNKLKYYNEQIGLQEDYVLQKHDLLITMTDLSKQGDTLGYPLLVPSSYKNTYLHNQRLGKVLPIKKSCFPKYFLRMYFQDFLYRSFVVGSSTGSTVKHTSPKKILFFKPNLPSLDSSIISEFENLIKPLFEVIDNLLLQQDLLKEARDILLPRLMSGMIDVDGLEVGESLGMVAEDEVNYNSNKS